jgi:hypothetical protein
VVSVLLRMLACRRHRVQTLVEINIFALNLINLTFLGWAEQLSDLHFISFIHSYLILVMEQVLKNHLLHVVGEILNINLSNIVFV